MNKEKDVEIINENYDNVYSLPEVAGIIGVQTDNSTLV